MTPGADTRSIARQSARDGEVTTEPFFDRYHDTHLAHRKGTIDAGYVEARARYFEQTWSSLVPADRAARILDAGCGVGSIVYWLQRRGYERSEGIDISGELIARGTALGIQNLRCVDIGTHLDDTVIPYDCIIFRDILEHFPRQRIVELLQRARRVLSPGGTVVVQVPNAEAPVWGRIRYGDFTHETAFTAASLTQLLGVTGFRTARFAPAGPILQFGRGLPRYLLWKVIELAYRVLLYGVSGRRRAIVTESIIAVAVRDEPRSERT